MPKPKTLKKMRMTMRRREMLTGYIFILPIIVGLAFFFFPMIFRVIQYSFHDVEIIIGERYALIPRGLDHYAHAFTVHPTYVQTLTGMLVDMLWNVPLIIFFSLFMAMILNRAFPGRLFVRAMFFLPIVMAVPAIQETLHMVTQMMSEGMVETVADVEANNYFDAASFAYMFIGFGIPYQLIDFIVGAVARLSVIIRSGGVQILIFLAALQAIPRSMYEAAQVEGTTAYESFWKITLPMISPLILTNTVYTIVDMFAQSQPLTMAFDLAFGPGVTNFGLSAVFSLTSTILVTILIVVSGFLISRKVVYLSDKE
ncbi:MAG: sugar ABC transporter permease [Defluviitaleaceae bacterium]|nr:sugar ABC transporter permease [Defluviitaleaceae bacterium]